MYSVPASSGVGRVFKSPPGQTKLTFAVSPVNM